MELFGPIALELFYGIVILPAKLLDDDRRAGPLAVFWLGVVGLAFGVLSSIIVPGRLLRPAPFLGASLVFLPLFGGLTMQCWGWFREAAGKGTSHLATWYGGGVFGLGYAAGRVFGLDLASNVVAL